MSAKTSIYTKLSEIQKTLQAPKSRFNSFGKYAYRSCEDILEAVKKYLIDGLTITVSDEMVLVGTRHYVKATAVLSDGDCRIEATAFAREPELKKGMDEAQITGATSSYARKYALNGLFAIDDAKDADNDDNRAEQVFEHAKPPVHAPQANKPALKANNLSNDQVRHFEITFGKFKGLTLQQIAAQETESGDSKGIAWMEWLIDQTPSTEEGRNAQEVVKRYLNELVTGQ